jgi:hypothetical protein
MSTHKITTRGLNNSRATPAGSPPNDFMSKSPTERTVAPRRSSRPGLVSIFEHAFEVMSSRRRAQSQVVLIAARFVRGLGGAHIGVLPDFAAAIAAAASER